MNRDKKFIISVCLSLILIAESLWSVNYLFASRMPAPSQQGQEPELTLKAQKASVGTGEEFKVSLQVLPKTKPIQALDAIIFFENEKLNVLELLPNPALQEEEGDFPQVKFDNVVGKLAISLVLPEKPINQEMEIAQLLFKALKEGEAKIWFDFIQGKTTDSNVVAEGDVNDSLSGVENLTILVNK